MEYSQFRYKICQSSPSCFIYKRRLSTSQAQCSNISNPNKFLSFPRSPSKRIPRHCYLSQNSPINSLRAEYCYGYSSQSPWRRIARRDWGVETGKGYVYSVCKNLYGLALVKGFMGRNFPLNFFIKFELALQANKDRLLENSCCTGLHYPKSNKPMRFGGRLIYVLCSNLF